LARKHDRAGFSPRFEGRQTLDGLLEIAGAPCGAPEVLERFRAAVAASEPRSEVIPSLFLEEPHFPDPALAQRLYQNLFGLWDLVATGRKVTLDEPEDRQKIPKAAPPPPPGPFGATPDAAWVEDAWRHLEGLDERAQERLWHSFENRQDALGVYLDGRALPDHAHGQASELLFELWAMLEAGWPAGLRAVMGVGEPGSPTEIPEALRAFMDEALFEAEQDETEPLSVEQSAQVRKAVEAGLAALWRARRS
jgi:hypothetical protein